MNSLLWNKLIEFETRDLVARHFQRRNNRQASASKILEITSNFIQGRGYFKNSEDANISVRPILQYYGVLSLSRALILFCSPLLSESSLKPSHGLNTINWQQTLSGKDFENLEVEVTKGAFYDLITATQNKSYLKKGSSGINYTYCPSVPNLPIKIKLIDLLACFPDLSDQFHSWTNKKMIFAEVDSITFPNNTMQIVLNKTLQAGEIEQLYPATLCPFRQSKLVGHQTFLTFPCSFYPFVTQKYVGMLGIGDVCVTPIINKTLLLNQLSLFFAASYYLGMLARYFPSIWISLNRTEKGDAFYPLVLRLIDIINEIYPQIILEFLHAPYDFEKKSNS